MIDYGVVGSIVTVVVFVAFIGVCIWAFSGKAKAGFDEAANLVFDDEKKQEPVNKINKNQEPSDNE